jgi:hypothetical protein
MSPWVTFVFAKFLQFIGTARSLLPWTLDDLGLENFSSPEQGHWKFEPLDNLG